MGRVLARAVEQSSGFSIIAGVDPVHDADEAATTVRSLDLVHESPDVVVDFSSSDATSGLLSWLRETKTPAVIATSGLEADGLSDLEKSSKVIPLVRAQNLSIGVTVMSIVARQASELLGESFDAEIVEKYHRKKRDAPSSTSLMLASSLQTPTRCDGTFVFGRHDNDRSRPAGEIAIHSVRGGTIVGEEEIIFAGQDEVITFGHQAISRDLFVTGALRAARFVIEREPGLYTMEDVVTAR
jgi:4-hydroxy-tetrahydrodipicolinate reductase